MLFSIRLITLPKITEVDRAQPPVVYWIEALEKNSMLIMMRTRPARLPLWI